MPPKAMSEEQWAIYQKVMADCRVAGIRFAVGGGLAVGYYTGRWRESKDIDLYVLPEDVERVKEVLTSAGLDDYYDQLPYDRAWIYRSVKDKIIVDAIFAMANHKHRVDEQFILDGPLITIGDVDLRLVPPEEMIWAKLYVIQRDRSDWPDILNIIDAQIGSLDWRRLIHRVGDDTALVSALLTVYRWLSPQKANTLPSWVWSELSEQASEVDASHRADLLDRRPWFGSLVECC